ncbi:hypothetical protein OIU77_003938 [Salix suchowensis]|uniref:Uncharacterized protein n=1 Tax=Salix suchowensis TaxID=1278906 RepID=A0ABQ9ATX6_9ROSI|nr:hypothetical protein OIU77_003938 [Salix suchowensis]
MWKVSENVSKSRKNMLLKVKTTVAMSVLTMEDSWSYRSEEGKRWGSGGGNDSHSD